MTAWITRSFRNLLGTAQLCMVLALGVPTFLYVTLAHTRQLVEERGLILSNLADTIATSISENLRERSREVDLLAKTPFYVAADFNDVELRASLVRMQQTYPYYSWIAVVDINGIVQVATGELLEGQSVEQRPWFQAARQGNFVGDLHQAQLLAKLLAPSSEDGVLRFIDFAVPILNKQGEPRAVLGVHAHWGWSKDLIKRIAPQEMLDNGVEIFIVSDDNKIIYPDLPEFFGQTLSVPGVSSDQAARYQAWGDAGQFLTAASRVASPQSTTPLNWKVVVRQPRDQVLEHALSLQRVITVVFGGALLLFMVIALFMGRYLGQPIHELSRRAQAIAAGKSAAFNQSFHTTEMRELNASLQEMSEKLLQNQHDLEKAAKELEQKVIERTHELAQTNLQLEAANQQLSSLARQDPLTSSPNRLAATEFLTHEFQQLKRRPVSYVVLLLDIDFFKKVNDTYGHATGDTVLKRVAQVLTRCIRENDFIGRVGGEEFMAVLPMTTLNDGAVVAEKIRAAVAAEHIEPVGHVSVSVGVSGARLEDPSTDEAIKRADMCLYAAKAAGRNRVVTDREDPQGNVEAWRSVD